MTPHFIVAGGLIGVLTGFLPICVLLLLRRRVTLVAYIQSLTAVILGVFLTLSAWPNGPRFDHLVGTTGTAWLIYQTALVATPFGQYTILTLSTTKDWARWRRGLAVVLTLVAAFWIAGIILARTPKLDHTYLFYEVAAGRPFASLVMNVAVGAALLWGCFLCARVCYRLRQGAQLIKERRWAIHVLTLSSLGMVLGALYAAQALLSLVTGDDASLFRVIDPVGALVVVIWLGRLLYRVAMALPVVRLWFLAELEPDRVQLGERLAAQLDAMGDLNRTVYDQAVHLFEYANRAVVTDMQAWCDARKVSRYERNYLHLAASMFTLNRANIEGSAYRAPDPEEVRAADEELTREAQFRAESGTYVVAEAGRVLQLVLAPRREWLTEPPGVRRDGAEALVNILRTRKLLDGGRFTAPPPLVVAAPGRSERRRERDRLFPTHRDKSDAHTA